LLRNLKRKLRKEMSVMGALWLKISAVRGCSFAPVD
jgi:hypothetical protein